MSPLKPKRLQSIRICKLQQSDGVAYLFPYRTGNESGLSVVSNGVARWIGMNRRALLAIRAGEEKVVRINIELNFFPDYAVPLDMTLSTVSDLPDDEWVAVMYRTIRGFIVEKLDNKRLLTQMQREPVKP